MIRFITNCFCLGLLFIAIDAQSAGMPVLEENDFPDLAVLENRSFGENQLFGYMNGGAEIYHEYGFLRLTVQDIEWTGTNFTIEIFKMQNKYAAFGIYSTSIHNCTKKHLSTRYLCITPYRVSAAKSNYYITVTNMQGDSLSTENSIVISEKILGKIPADQIELPQFYRKNQADMADGLKLFLGDLALRNNDSQLLADLGESAFREIWELDCVENGEPVKRTIIIFSTGNDYRMFVNKYKIAPDNRWQKFNANKTKFIRMNREQLSAFILNGNIQFDDLNN